MYRKLSPKLAEASGTFSKISRKFSRKLAKASRTFSESYQKFSRKLAEASGTISEISRKSFRQLAEASRTFSESYQNFSQTLCEALHIVHFNILNYAIICSNFFRVKYAFFSFFVLYFYPLFTTFYSSAQYSEPRISPKIHLEHSPKATETLTENLTQHYLYLNNLQ